jgi:hypothetical protein
LREGGGEEMMRDTRLDPSTGRCGPGLMAG